MIYTYDKYGNISTKTVNGEEIKYVYDKAGVKLLSYGDQSYSYDNLNNPTNLNATYYTLTWSKNQLESARAASHMVSFTYDADGLLLTRSIGGQKEQFFYEDGRLIRRLDNYTTAMDFLYGQEGLIGFRYNGSDYLYQKNLLGDVVKIIDSTGAVVGEYSYTAFGECTIVTNINNIAYINPFRYRGYYLEPNTGLYYLKTRFYNPITGRFISPDDTKYLQPDTINGLNLFAYCGNNPVMNIDPNGNFAISLTYLGIAAIAFLGALVIGEVEKETHVLQNTFETFLGGVEGVIDWVSDWGSNESIKVVTNRNDLTIYFETALNDFLYNVLLSKNPQDPYARPGQKKQGRELKNKARQKFTNKSKFRGGRKPPKKHTPGRGHRKYMVILRLIYEQYKEKWELD